MSTTVMDESALTEELIAHRGIEYKLFMQFLIKYFAAQRYLEIGTQAGISLSMMPCDSIAIDPHFMIDRPIMDGKNICMLFQMPSDRFFEKYDPARLLDGPLDVVFLDGMHRCEYLLRDFANIERSCRKNSLICLHDCLPPTLEMTSRKELASTMSDVYRGYWTGDVWKAVPMLKKLRPKMKIHFVDCPPTGLVICTNLEPASGDAAEKYADLVEEALHADDDYANLKALYASQSLLSSQSLMQDHEMTKLFWL